MAGHALSHAIKYRVEIEGMRYPSMKYATLAYTGRYDDSVYRKVKKENNLSVIDALHFRCRDMLMMRLDGYKHEKQQRRQYIVDAALALDNQIDRLYVALTARTEMLSTSVRFCLRCGCPFEYVKRSRDRFCSEEHRDKSSNEAKARASAKHRQIRGKDSHRIRAHKYGGSWIRGITWKSIAKRSGMKCAVCGVRCIIPRGKNKLNEATVGHVVALANGGDHGWHNVQLECRSCNQSHGSRDHGQLGLRLGA